MSEKGDIAAVFGTLGHRLGLAQGLMFGKHCLKVHGNVFAVADGGGVAFKLPEPTLSEASGLEGAARWDPSGRGAAMREWVLVPAARRSEWRRLAGAAYEYVSKLF